MNFILRLISLIGVMAIAIFYTFVSKTTQQIISEEVFFLISITFVLIFVCIIFFRKELKFLLSNLDILVPLGYFVLFTELFRLITVSSLETKLLSFAVTDRSTNFLPLSSLEFFRLSYIFVSSVLFAGWTILLLIRRLDLDKNSGLFETLFDVKTIWQRVALVLGLGNLIALLFTFGLSQITNGIASYAFVLSCFCLLWSAITAPLLIVVIRSKENLISGLLDGFRIGWEKFSTWFFPVILHSLLLGIIVIVPTTTLAEFFKNIIRWQQPEFLIKIKYIWTGGFSNTFNWHQVFMQASEKESSLLAGLYLAYLLLLFAIIIKIKIAFLLKMKEKPSAATIISLTNKMNFEKAV